MDAQVGEHGFILDKADPQKGLFPIKSESYKIAFLEVNHVKQSHTTYIR